MPSGQFPGLEDAQAGASRSSRVSAPPNFYEAVESGLFRRKLPGAKVSNVRWAEGGVLSPDREYFRIEGSVRPTGAPP